MVERPLSRICDVTSAAGAVQDLRVAGRCGPLSHGGHVPCLESRAQHAPAVAPPHAGNQWQSRETILSTSQEVGKLLLLTFTLDVNKEKDTEILFIDDPGLRFITDIE